MRKVYFFYEFSDGFSRYMTGEEATKRAQETGATITRDDLKRSQEASVRMTKDGFQIGYNPALGMHIRGRKHYSQVLKERNLIEMGKERRKPTERIERKLIDDEILKAAIDQGADISGREAEALKDGSFDLTKIPEGGIKTHGGGFYTETQLAGSETNVPD